MNIVVTILILIIAGAFLSILFSIGIACIIVKLFDSKEDFKHDRR